MIKIFSWKPKYCVDLSSWSWIFPVSFNISRMKLNKVHFSLGTVITHFLDKSYQEINFKSHLSSALLCKWGKRLSDLHIFRVILFHFTRFVLTFAMTLKSANYKNHWNTLVFYNQWKIMSDLIYVPWANAWFWFNSIVWFTLVIKVKIEILKIKNSLIFSNLGSCCQIKICPGVFFFFFSY